MNKAIISGVYDTKVGSLPESTCMSLHAEAGLGAIRDAGLRVEDIDGLLTAYSFTAPALMLGPAAAEYIGLKAKVNASISMGGVTAGLMIAHAVALVRAGMCRHVLCLTGDNRLTGLGPKVQESLATIGHPQYEQPYGMSIATGFALAAQAYMNRYGMTLEQMAATAVALRQNASRHPNAQMRAPITLDDVAKSKMVASPLRVLDCCLVSDGGSAVVVSAADTARDLPKQAVEILGIAEEHTHEHFFEAPSLTEHGCAGSAARAFAEAGVEPKDVSSAHIYDCFTSTLLICLESMGFYEPGAAGQAALNGEFDISGRLPVNTNGGLMSYGSSGAAGGMFHVVEAVRQLRGEAEERQIASPQIAFAHTLGGIFSAHCSMVLGRH
jgi:acetyl-CoA acetyltransferase